MDFFRAHDVTQTKLTSHCMLAIRSTGHGQAADTLQILYVFSHAARQAGPAFAAAWA